ncbi:hypothetical protein HDV02_000358 [Globomyces sp. JEL0801]|nr:hypothetical protein HDV02_000358 [Globomyces sp. JEL0801]
MSSNTQSPELLHSYLINNQKIVTENVTTKNTINSNSQDQSSQFFLNYSKSPILSNNSPTPITLSNSAPSSTELPYLLQKTTDSILHAIDSLSTISNNLLSKADSNDLQSAAIHSITHSLLPKIYQMYHTLKFSWNDQVSQLTARSDLLASQNQSLLLNQNLMLEELHSLQSKHNQLQAHWIDFENNHLIQQNSLATNIAKDRVINNDLLLNSIRESALAQQNHLITTITDSSAGSTPATISTGTVHSDVALKTDLIGTSKTGQTNTMFNPTSASSKIQATDPDSILNRGGDAQRPLIGLSHGSSTLQDIIQTPIIISSSQQQKIGAFTAATIQDHSVDRQSQRSEVCKSALTISQTQDSIPINSNSSASKKSSIQTPDGSIPSKAVFGYNHPNGMQSIHKEILSVDAIEPLDHHLAESDPTKSGCLNSVSMHKSIHDIDPISTSPVNRNQLWQPKEQSSHQNIPDHPYGYWNSTDYQTQLLKTRLDQIQPQFVNQHELFDIQQLKDQNEKELEIKKEMQNVGQYTSKSNNDYEYDSNVQYSCKSELSNSLVNLTNVKVDENDDTVNLDIFSKVSTHFNP